jgi:hypothetical protein
MCTRDDMLEMTSGATALPGDPLRALDLTLLLTSP